MNADLAQTSADIQRHELLADVAEQVATRLIKQHEIPEEKAADVGNAIADFLADHWHGQQIYMNGDAKYKLSKRDHQIYEQMQRGNAHELAKTFGISTIRVYQIYSRCLQAARAKRQPQLFTEPAPIALTINKK
jgi:Mor family transcriptional regulator